MNPKKNLIFLMGPTASGKTQTAIELAKKYNALIINADSRQIYKYLNIGTAKPNNVELSQIKHFLVDFVEPSDYFSVADFEKKADEILKNEFENRETMIVAGGTGLYFRALEKGLDNIPDVPTEFRNQLNLLYEQNGITLLQQKLLEVDEITYNKIDLMNPQRILRALEVSLYFKQPFSSFLNKNSKKLPYNLIKIVLNPNREILYNQINQRVLNMIENGLFDEIENIKSMGYDRNINALQTVGYTEVFDFWEGKYSYKECIEKIQQHTRNYAKRQITWFKKEENSLWLEPESVLNYNFKLKY